jgi:hypothetical protein
MKRVNYLLAATLAMTALAAMAADSTNGTGWISDSMCAGKHAGAGADKACVQKCIAGGEKPVFVDSKNTVWTIDNPGAVKAFYGDHVKVSMSTNASAKSVHIDSVAAAK